MQPVLFVVFFAIVFGILDLPLDSSDELWQPTRGTSYGDLGTVAQFRFCVLVYNCSFLELAANLKFQVAYGVLLFL